MATLTPAARVALRGAVRNYLERMPNVNVAEREVNYATVNTSLVTFMARTFCSSARPPGFEEMYKIDVQQLGNAHGGLGADIGAVEDFALTPDHELSIQQTLNRRRGISVVYVRIATSPIYGHASLLVFDARTRKQHFFHPWGYTNHWLNRAFRYRQNVIVQGFEAAPLNEDAWPQGSDSLQTLFDNNQFDLRGNCAMYCVLVGVLCTRFGIGKPRLMADLIIEVLRQIDVDNGLIANNEQNPVGSHMPRMCNWMADMGDLAKTFTLPPLFPYSTNTQAMVHVRNSARQRSNQALAQQPQLFPGPPHHHTQQKIARRQRFRQRHTLFLQTHPVIYIGHVVDAQTVAARNDAIRDAEVELLRRMFPPSEMCNVVLRTGRLCSRRACAGQPLCWQHKFLTRNHMLTGAGRMRCAAVQAPCV